MALFGLVWASALFGDTDPFRNLAPTWIYVIFWLGMPVLSVVLGNVWRALSPWRAIADAFVWIRERSGGEARPLAEYPERLGRWPAAVALFAFVALELAYSDPASPRALAFAIALYTYVALFGMAAFGRETWERSGEAFAVLFGLLALLAPLHVVDGRIRLRWPLTGLAGAEPDAGDGRLRRGDARLRPLRRVQPDDDLAGPHGGCRGAVPREPTRARRAPRDARERRRAARGGAARRGSRTRGACALSRASVNAPRSLVPDFVRSLLPIAFVYVVAHYVSLFLIQGQFAIPLLSDPLGRGWDLFGTARRRARPVGDPSPNVRRGTSRYGALAVGHVAGLAVAHDRAVTIFPDKRNALVSQLPFLALMVLYTLGGLWVLSRG